MLGFCEAEKFRRPLASSPQERTSVSKKRIGESISYPQSCCLTLLSGRVTNTIIMNTSKAVELIEKSERVLLLLPEKASLDCLAASEALSGILESKGKHVGLIYNPPEGNSQNTPTSKIINPRQPLYETVISLDVSRAPISELRYDKNENGLEIVLSPKSAPIEKEYFSFKKGKITKDCLITLGINDIESFNTQGLEPEFFTETPIINIDNSSQNKNYGEINLINAEKPSISEMVFEFITSLNYDNLDKKGATLLLAGLISQTPDLYAGRCGANTLSAASKLVKLGADQNEALAMTQKSKPIQLLQLLGRASVRSRLDKERGLLWSFITAEDFEKTGQTKDNIKHVLQYLGNEFPPHRVLTLLWQNPQDKLVRAAFAGEKPVLESIKLKTGGEFQSPHLMIPVSFETFREAEEKLSSLLEGVL